MPDWKSVGNFFRSVGRGAAKAGKFTLRILKWPTLIILPVFVFVVSAWFSLINTFSGDIREVPDVRGKSPREAATILSMRGFSLDEDYREKERKPSTEIDEGLVLDQEPAAGARVKRGSVSVTLSAGFQEVLVPNLLHNANTMKPMSFRDAELEAEKKGFKLRVREVIFSDEVPDNRNNYVIAQKTMPSIRFPKVGLEPIEVLTSSGPNPEFVMIPPLENRPLARVLSFLKKNKIPYIIKTSRGEDITNRLPYGQKYTIYDVRGEPVSFFPADTPPTLILRVRESN